MLGRPHPAGPGGRRVWAGDGAAVRAALPWPGRPRRRERGRARVFGGQVCDLCAAGRPQKQRVRLGGAEERGGVRCAQQGAARRSAWPRGGAGEGWRQVRAGPTQTHKNAPPPSSPRLPSPHSYDAFDPADEEEPETAFSDDEAEQAFLKAKAQEEAAKVGVTPNQVRGGWGGRGWVRPCWGDHADVCAHILGRACGEKKGAHPPAAPLTCFSAHLHLRPLSTISPHFQQRAPPPRAGRGGRGYSAPRPDHGGRGRGGWAPGRGRNRPMNAVQAAMMQASPILQPGARCRWSWGGVRR